MDHVPFKVSVGIHFWINIKYVCICIYVGEPYWHFALPTWHWIDRVSSLSKMVLFFTRIFPNMSISKASITILFDVQFSSTNFNSALTPYKKNSCFHVCPLKSLKNKQTSYSLISRNYIKKYLTDIIYLILKLSLTIY